MVGQKMMIFYLKKLTSSDQKAKYKIHYTTLLLFALLILMII